MMPDFVAVLAGGKSTRLGRDKAAEKIAGIMMLECAVRTARAVCNHVLVLGREKPPDGWPPNLAVPFLPDGIPSADPAKSGGPLIGLIRALDQAQNPILLLACDIPLLSADTLRSLLGAHRDDAAATIAQLNGQPEPTVAVYSPALIPMLHQMLAENRRSLQPLARLPHVALWPVPEERAHEFLNVNDEASLAEARRRMGER